MLRPETGMFDDPSMKRSLRVRYKRNGLPVARTLLGDPAMFESWKKKDEPPKLKHKIRQRFGGTLLQEGQKIITRHSLMQLFL